MTDLKIYLSAPVELAQEASRYARVAMMACSVGRGMRLLRSRNIPRLTSPRLLEVSCTGMNGFGPHRALAEDIVRQCLMFGFSGAVLELGRPTPPLLAFAGLLGELCHGHGLSLYLPDGYAGASPDSRIVIPAQNFSGTYSSRLSMFAARYGPDRLALRLERRASDFALPSRQSRPGLRPAPPDGPPPERAFYSEYHEANYMTYQDAGRVHLVMWDDLNSIRRKLDVAAGLGISRAFLYYPDCVDIISQLTP